MDFSSYLLCIILGIILKLINNVFDVTVDNWTSYADATGYRISKQKNELTR